ncbi:cytochrome b [Kordiimonas laminariae]|uniref:cytochrome b n=1 Tax=Kordiimonas laminariae TaxID=2917717 RepID=UPI001FF108F9|nr:cytochrome b [Kordiimonas laminariae]MCK0070682.1 cytochrome b [Kordiimonas laminariae]
MSAANNTERYTKVAILLHWLIAFAIIGLMAAGIWMTGAIKEKETQATAFEVYQIHKSIGLTVLVLSVVRLIWRFTHKAPAMPSGMVAWERMAAHTTHFLFYALMIGLPITGWLMVSASPWGLPTMYFNQFEVPHLHALSSLDMAGKQEWEGVFKEMHEVIAYGGIALIVLHIGAALKHHVIAKDNTLVRMLPFLKTPVQREEE